MIDIVYPIRKGGSRWADNELRYSLRSIEKHLINFRNVYIIGHKPDFLQNVIHIEANDTEIVPDKNILNKILKACKQPEISQQFLFFNDDHFLLSDFRADEFPYFYCSTLRQYVRKRADNYGVRSRNTMNYLESKGLPGKHFDIHFPILYDKSKFKEIFSDLPPKQHGYIIKSLYANALKIQGTETKDCKSQEPPPKEFLCFSTHPRPMTKIEQWLAERFPEKCIFEV